jgi:hypothetical protein
MFECALWRVADRHSAEPVSGSRVVSLLRSLEHAEKVAGVGLPLHSCTDGLGFKVVSTRTGWQASINVVGGYVALVLAARNG